MDRLLPDELLGRGQVDQVRSVDDDGIEVIVACRLCKCRAIYGVTGHRAPAARVTGKDLYSAAANLPGNLCGLDRFGMSGHVAANTFHSISCSRVSAFGSCSRRVRPNCCKNSPVVANSAGRPTVCARPTSATSPCCIRLARARSLFTPRMASICARVTGWRYAMTASVSMAAEVSFADMGRPNSAAM